MPSLAGKNVTVAVTKSACSSGSGRRAGGIKTDTSRPPGAGTVKGKLRRGKFIDGIQHVDRIDVIRGPGGTIWGPNAVNGVINIITKSSADTYGVLAAVAGWNLFQPHHVEFSHDPGPPAGIRRSIYAQITFNR
jgi:hypothetical protein